MTKVLPSWPIATGQAGQGVFVDEMVMNLAIDVRPERLRVVVLEAELNVRIEADKMVGLKGVADPFAVVDLDGAVQFGAVPHDLGDDVLGHAGTADVARLVGAQNLEWIAPLNPDHDLL